ncbi:MAG: hypothetical protein V7K50_24165 [Nostoc sp.]|uniref:hypothetical protein n=1 Tax=Nostoc sp. TaxID=1180 RepID=UPI002FF55398
MIPTRQYLDAFALPSRSLNDIAYLLRQAIAGNGTSFPCSNSRTVRRAILPITIFAPRDFQRINFPRKTRDRFSQE